MACQLTVDHLRALLTSGAVYLAEQAIKSLRARLSKGLQRTTRMASDPRHTCESFSNDDWSQQVDDSGNDKMSLMEDVIEASF